MKDIYYWLVVLIIGLIMFSCEKKVKNEYHDKTDQNDAKMASKSHEIVDCNYTFEEAIAGSDAPQKIINELVLLDVRYYSTDNKIHKGQILTNRKIAADIVELFEFMISNHFPVYQAIPIVHFDWDDNKSMAANNSSSFCYRNVANTDRKSKHSTGMAIDINPYFNPIRYKSPQQSKPNTPEGSVLDTTVAGTLYAVHPVVKEFKRRGFRWGHHFRKYFDDHHFDK